MSKLNRFLSGHIAVALVVFASSATALANGWEGSEDQRLFRSGDIAGVKRIIKERPELYSRVHPTALSEAIDRGQTELVKYLASLGWLEQCKKEPSCGDPFLTAAINEDFDLMEFLMVNGYPPSTISLQLTAGMHKYKVVEFHIANGIRGESTALRSAAKAKDIRMVELLLANGSRGDPLALYYAANAGDINIVKVLCASGSDPDIMLPLEGRNTTAALELAWSISNESMQNEARVKLQEILNYFKSGQCKKSAKP